MKKRGFTLIELLAVIVIIAIIALIATPLVLNTIDEAKKGAAKASATTYIQEVEKQVTISEINTPRIEDGIYDVGNLTNVQVKGNGPTNGQITIEEGIVVSAKLCVDNYSIDYSDSKAEISNNNYCGKEVILNIKGEEIKQNVAQEIEFDITGKDISDVTNIVCNNGAKVELEDNKVIVSNVIGNTICTMNTSLITTVNNLDDSENYIFMLNDDNLSNTINIPESKKISLELSDFNITLNLVAPVIRNYGDLIIKSETGTGSITNTILEECGASIHNLGYLEINSGTIESKGICATIYSGTSSNQKGKIVINDGHIKQSGTSHAIMVYSTDEIPLTINNASTESIIGNSIVAMPTFQGTININGGTFNSGNISIYNRGTGTVNICNGTIYSESYDFYINNAEGFINYSSNVTFTNGVNNPNTGGLVENIISNYIGTCS